MSKLPRVRFAAARGALALVGLVGCDDSGGGAEDAGADAAPACLTQVPTACAEPATRYADVQAIFATRCATATCHDGRDPEGEWPLVTYGHASDWADLIRDEVAACSMPPADSGVTLTTQESNLLLRWWRCGYLE